MAALRNAWQKAKAEIKVKGWENQLKFQDNLGPNLDTFENTVSQVEAQLKVLRAGMQKLEATAKPMKSIAKSYENKIPADPAYKPLRTGLDTTLFGAGEVCRVLSNKLKILHGMAEGVKRSLV